MYFVEHEQFHMHHSKFGICVPMIAPRGKHTTILESIKKAIACCARTSAPPSGPASRRSWRQCPRRSLTQMLAISVLAGGVYTGRRDPRRWRRRPLRSDLPSVRSVATNSCFDVVDEGARWGGRQRRSWRCRCRREYPWRWPLPRGRPDSNPNGRRLTVAP